MCARESASLVAFVIGGTGGGGVGFSTGGIGFGSGVGVDGMEKAGAGLRVDFPGGMGTRGGAGGPVPVHFDWRCDDSRARRCSARSAYS